MLRWTGSKQTIQNENIEPQAVTLEYWQPARWAVLKSRTEFCHKNNLNMWQHVKMSMAKFATGC